MSTSNKNNYTFPLIILTTLFFAWGFITALNDILIPYLRQVFDLTTFQSTLIQMAFFGAYFVGSVVYFLISSVYGDPIARIGYKNGIIAGLVVSAAGCLLFLPAISFHVYGFFLGALFTLGLGLTLLQITSNPYVALLGPEESAPARLNLSQGFNSFGTTISPVIGGFLIFEYFHTESAGAESVRLPYVFLALGFLLLAVMIKFVKLPRVTEEDLSGEKGVSIFSYPNLVFGIGAIFFYVGGEVAIGSLLVNFLGLPEIAGLEEVSASKLLALYWGGAMIGRFVGSISMNEELDKSKKIIYMLIAAVGGYALITYLSGLGLVGSLPFIGFLVLQMALFYLAKGKANRVLFIFSLTVIALLFIGVFTDGVVAMWSVVSIGLFNSIMWSNIFTLSIAGLGGNTSKGSSLLVMAILGGALVPPAQGLIADSFGLHLSFLLPVICYAYLAFFGMKGYQPKS